MQTTTLDRLISTCTHKNIPAQRVTHIHIYIHMRTHKLTCTQKHTHKITRAHNQYAMKSHKVEQKSWKMAHKEGHEGTPGNL